MDHQVFLAGSGTFADARELIETYGSGAGDEAKSRARRSRDLGNVVHFCRWREIERLIGAMTAKDMLGSVQ